MTSQTRLFFIAVIWSTTLVTATAARGCLSYGHSCLGAHGKRSSSSSSRTLETVADAAYLQGLPARIYRPVDIDNELDSSSGSSESEAYVDSPSDQWDTNSETTLLWKNLIRRLKRSRSTK